MTSQIQNKIDLTPPEPPPFDQVEPPDEWIADMGYAPRRQESGGDYSANYSETVPPSGKSTEFAWMDGVIAAWEGMALLADLCDRIMLGGSLRRGKARVGDIELICRPSDPLRFQERCERLLASGRLALRLNKKGYRIAWSDRYRAVLFKGLPLDLFIVQPDRSWGETAVIRTGPNAANQVLVTKRGQRSTLGDAGVLPINMIFNEGVLWRDRQVLDTAEEADVFYECGLPWVSPWKRSVETYQRAAAWGLKRPFAHHQPMDGDDYPRREWGDAVHPAYARSPEGRWYVLDVPTLLTRRPELGTEIDALRVAEEAARITQAVLM